MTKINDSELAHSRYLASWREREIDKDGTLKPFSPEELEHIILLNNHLKALTSAVIDKTLWLSLHALEELQHGNKDFADYDIKCGIEMTYDIDDCDETLRKLIELSWDSHFYILRLDADMTKEKQEAEAAETKELYNTNKTVSVAFGTNCGISITSPSPGLLVISSITSASSP